jgi:geranylgeranyl pyrophosphate synthase
VTSVLDLARASFTGERAAVDRALAAFCERYLDDIAPAVGEAIRYGLLGEGKRLRAILLMSSYHAAGGEGDASKLGAALEVVHAYSLVHDDLPCMDDDDVRRGRPTVHRVFGVDVASAAGVTMVPLAVRCAFGAAIELGRTPAEAADIIAVLLEAAGAHGMIGGQQLDLESEGHALTLEQMERVHRLKTGALITAAARIGGMAARAGERAVDALARYGSAIGLAFQITDDVLDVTGSTNQLGKTAGRDVELHKSTYPALLGIEGAVARAEALVSEACAALEREALLTPQLETLAQFVVRRAS